MDDFERCTRCGALTGKAGRDEDSNYIELLEQEVGPLCDSCLDDIVVFATTPI